MSNAYCNFHIVILPCYPGACFLSVYNIDFRSQTNPCQHPVIILQDVHFPELEALLCFVYKGEVNIEQDDLPALLKAAESLQIRGLSGSSSQTKV